jgi:protein-S-isoprenylcysteine O-methyltransferase Ste14
MLTLLARLRVPLGFLSAAIAFVLARPSWPSWIVGLAVALVGESLRLWAAGHIEKGKEITHSGPYRFVRHPLYVGSTMLGLGFAIAAHSVAVAALVALYLGVTLTAAVRTEEAALDEKFSGGYADYRAGRTQAESRPFSWNRARANGEHRAVAGLAAVFVLLVLRIGV